jgi:competence protein ComEA
VSPAASTAREAVALANASPLGDREARRFSPAEAEPRGDDGGGLEAPAARPSWFGRTRATFRKSVWAPVALKLVGLTLAMCALSGVGVASMLSGADGVRVPLAGMLGADIRAPWLANQAATGPHPNGGSSAHTAPSAAVALGAGALPNAATAGSNDVPMAAVAPANPVAETREPARASTSAGMTEDGKVILNLAGAEDLRHLPGVGQKRADAILALRSRLGRFKQMNDLLRVKGIGVRGLKKIMPHAVLDAPKPAAG